MIIWIAPVLGFLRSALPYALLFLRGLPDLLAPKPITAAPPYTPPFVGGQCNEDYWVQVVLYTNEGGVVYQWTNGSASGNPDGNPPNSTTPISGGVKSISSALQFNGANVTIVGGSSSISFFVPNYGQGNKGIPTIFRVRRTNGAADNCGDIPNPISPPPIADDGLFNPTNPRIADNNGTLNPATIVLAPALPLVLVGAIAAGYAAAMAAAKTATDILGGIQKLGEGFEFLKDLLKKLAEDLDEKEKLKPKNRDIVRQTYGQIKGDGAIDFFPDNNTKFEPIQIDIIIVFVPAGYGKYFGSFSPHRYRYRELGYISFYSVNQGILETHSIQFKRTTLQIPPLAIGFIYHLGLDEQVRGFAFGTFSVEKS